LTVKNGCSKMELSHHMHEGLQFQVVRMKKRLPAFLLAAMLVASLAACSGGEEEPAKTVGSLPADGQTEETNPSREQATLTEPSITLAAEPSNTLATGKVSASEKPSATGAVEKTAVKRVESTPTVPSAQKTAAFTFSQKFPLEIVCYGARFQITDAKISAVEMSGDGCSFQFSCSAKRLEDGVDGAKNCTVRIKWLNESGKQVKATTAGIGLLKPGESGHGNTTLGMKSSEMQASPNHRFTVVLEGYGTAQ